MKKSQKPNHDKLTLVFVLLSFMIVFQLLTLILTTKQNTPEGEELSASATLSQVGSQSIPSSTITNSQSLSNKSQGTTMDFAINEVKYTDKYNAQGIDKFIELVNYNNSQSIKVDGWTLVLITSNNQVYKIPLKANDFYGETIDPYETYGLCIAGKNYGGGVGYCDQYLDSSYNSLINHQFDLQLIAPDGTIIDHVGHRGVEVPNNGWPDVSLLDANHSLQLAIPSSDNNNGKNWCSLYPTPGSYSPTQCPKNTNTLVINEIHYTVNPKDPRDHRYIELYNNSNLPIALPEVSSKLPHYNLPIYDESNSSVPMYSQQLGFGVVKPHGYWLLCEDSWSVAGYPCDQPIWWSSFKFWTDQNFNFKLDRHEDNKNFYFTFGAVDHWGKTIASNNWPDVIPHAQYESISLKDASTDNNNGVNWCITDPSPGWANKSCK